MRMIESDKLVPLFRLLLMGYPQNIADSMCEDIQAMVDAHTVDAVPVMRGEWIEKPNPNWQAYSHEHCSICGWENGTQAKKYRGLHYCPDCGAKMSMK